MFEQFFQRAHILERHRNGPYAQERCQYLTHLLRKGHSQHRIAVIGNLLLQASKSLNLGGGEPVNMTALTEVGETWLQQRTRPTTQRRNLQVARRDFISVTSDWLRFLGRLQETHPPSPFGEQLEEFLRHLQEERGLADVSVAHRRRCLAQFFLWLSARGGSIATIGPKDITEYFSAHGVRSWKRATVKSYADCLRSFFRYAGARSWCVPGIDATVEGPRIYSFEALPQGPTWKDVQRLIASLRDDHPTQIRNRAVVLLLAVYGFRIGEVCKLTLDDICWETELIHVRRSRQRKVQDYPLTVEVGTAILKYLKKVRPKSCHRELFLTLRTPFRPILPASLGGRIALLLRQLDKQLPHYGPHTLRHACAPHLLSLWVPEILSRFFQIF